MRPNDTLRCNPDVDVKLLTNCKDSFPPRLLHKGRNMAINNPLMLNRHRRRQRKTQVRKPSSAGKLKNASTVDSKIMRAMRRFSAPKRSASTATLLALGDAAASSV